MSQPPTDGNARSPVVVIKQKELELADRLAAARRAAERTILEARRQAAERRDQAERDARAAVSAFQRARLDAADADADRIRADGELAAAELAQNGARALEQAAQLIVEFVMPSLPAG